MASQLHYLTVQDILWINLQVTENVQTFSYAKLEEATYYQYSYGASNSLIPQAARLLTGFPKLSPLTTGNAQTTFIACLTFLEINGMTIDLTDEKGADWFTDAASKKVDGATAIQSIAKPSTGHHDLEIRKTIRDLVDAYPKTLKALA